MIRWSYVIPRLILLALVLALVRWGLDPLLRWSLVSVGERVVGAKVEVKQLATRLATTEIRLSEVQVAHPQRPMKNLFEADEIHLRLETNPLLRRKFVVREGEIRGLRFDTDRTTPGKVQPRRWVGEMLLDELAERIDPAQVARFGQAWLDRLAFVLKQEITEQLQQLESVRLARQFAQRWPAELAQLETEAERLRGRVDRLRQLSEGLGKNVLRSLDSAQQMLAEADALREDFAAFRNRVESLREQVLRDRESIRLAQEHDVRRVRERLRLEELESGDLSEYLLGHEFHERVQTAARWIRWLRAHWPSSPDMPPPPRARGTDVVFAGLAPQPAFLVRLLHITGQVPYRGEALAFEGTLRGLCFEPAVYGQPAVLSVAVSGPVRLNLEAVLDRTGPVPRDYLTVQIPRLAQPRRLLGQAEQLALVVSPGDSQIALRLELVGEELSGQLTVRQEPIELVPELSTQYGGPALATRLRKALADVHQIEASAEISGTLDRPQWKVHSNVAPLVVRGFQQLLARELQTRREELSRLVQQEVDQRTALFEQTFTARHQALLAVAQQGGVDLQQLRDLVARRVPGLDRALQKKLPIDLPFRF